MIVKVAIGMVAGIMLASQPALADETATAAQITGAVQTASQDVTGRDNAGTSQQEFGQLFASWRELDHGGHVTADGTIVAAPQEDVSIPNLIPVQDARLTSPFGEREHPILGRMMMHKGVDLAVPRGTPVHATADGRVAMAQRFGSYGNYVEIEHGGELETRYAHLASYTVHPGEWVHEGEVIGYVGTTGRSTGPHLHYEVRVDGKAVNPAFFMNQHFASLEQGEGAVGGPSDED